MRKRLKNRLYRIFERLYRRWNQYCLRTRLKNHDFSIISNTCIGGIMYHELGEQFRTPLINVGFEDKDFPKFAQNLKWYMEQPLRFAERDGNTPIAYCGDIRMYFPHDHSEAEIERKWDERKKRINYDNLFFICGDRTDLKRENGEITYEDILGLKSIPCKGKVVFSIRDYRDIDYIVHLPKDPNGEYVHPYTSDRTSILRRWSWEILFDYVHWLNTGEIKYNR